MTTRLKLQVAELSPHGEALKGVIGKNGRSAGLRGYVAYRDCLGEPKTEASRRPVPLHPLALDALTEWRKEALFNKENDFIFASLRLNGEKPLGSDSILKKSIRPALQRTGISGKTVGFHTFRHSVATQLRTIGVDLKGRQEFLRHASPRVTDASTPTWFRTRSGPPAIY